MMILRRRRSTAALYLLGDLFATLAAFFSAWWVRFELELPAVTKGVPDIGHYVRLIPVVMVLWPIVFYFHGLYQPRRNRSRLDEVLTLMLAVAFATLLLSGMLFLYRPESAVGEELTFSRGFVFWFILLAVFFCGASRLAIRRSLEELRIRGHNLRRILIAGAGTLGREIAAKLQAHRELGLEVVGFLDDDRSKSGTHPLGLPILGTLADAERVMTEKSVDQVYVALPFDAHRKMTRMLQVVAKECVELKIVPDILQYAALNASLEDLDGTPVINLSQVPLEGWNSLAKRALDVVVASAALLGLTFVLPVLPLIALAIWWEDRGPILYQQERMGLDGRSFMMLKFRSMRVDAESSTGPVWAIRDDPRRTSVGSFLRKTSLDELPQLWNVIRGDMSIVGPRPERPTFVHEFKHKLPDYMQRHRVKAGITGWAQVHGWRGNTSIRKRLQYDLYYIQNWSLGLDLKIIWMTLRANHWKNAY